MWVLYQLLQAHAIYGGQASVAFLEHGQAYGGSAKGMTITDLTRHLAIFQRNYLSGSRFSFNYLLYPFPELTFSLPSFGGEGERRIEARSCELVRNQINPLIHLSP